MIIHTNYSCQILTKLEFSRQIFEKSSNIKFHENPSSGSRVVPYGRTFMTKITVAFQSFEKAPKNLTIHVVHFATQNDKFPLPRVLHCKIKHAVPTFVQVTWKTYLWKKS